MELEILEMNCLYRYFITCDALANSSYHPRQCFTACVELINWLAAFVRIYGALSIELKVWLASSIPPVINY